MPKTTSKTYRPLLDCLTIGKSKIEGLGLIATKKIPAKKDLGLFHIKVGGEIIRTPLSGFVNHSEVPNCHKAKRYNKWHLHTDRTIQTGEELTIKYDLYKIK